MMSLGTSAVNNELETKGQNSKWNPSTALGGGDKDEDHIDSAESDDDDEVVIGQNYKASQPKEVQQLKESRSLAGSVYQQDKHAGFSEGLSLHRTAKSKRIDGKENHSGKEPWNRFYYHFFTFSGHYEVSLGQIFLWYIYIYIYIHTHNIYILISSISMRNRNRYMNSEKTYIYIYLYIYIYIYIFIYIYICAFLRIQG